MSVPLASFPTLKLASTELNRVFNLVGEGVAGRIQLGKHQIKPEGKHSEEKTQARKPARPKVVFDLLDKGLSREQKKMVRKILKNPENFAC